MFYNAIFRQKKEFVFIADAIYRLKKINIQRQAVFKPHLNISDNHPEIYNELIKQ